MGVRSTRRHLLARALALALAVIVSASALAFFHAPDDDPGGRPALVHHDDAAHRFTQSARDGARPPQHCFICHTLRLLHGALTAAGGRVTVDLRFTPCGEQDRRQASAVGRSAADSRAPPPVSL